MKNNNFIGKNFITKSFKETQKLGKEFARSFLARLQGKTLIIALYGDLGSGKTTFVQGLAVGLGIKNRIISPTFIIVRCYELQNQKSKIKNQNNNANLKSLELTTFYHIDLYRVENERGLEDLGLEEIINNKNNIVVIEWAEKLKSLMSEKRIDIEFSYEKDSVRKITFRPRRP